MRPFKPRMRSRGCRSPRGSIVHGAPVHRSSDSIGSRISQSPDYGDCGAGRRDEIPVFWACVVNSAAVIAAAKLPFAITHAPGLML